MMMKILLIQTVVENIRKGVERSKKKSRRGNDSDDEFGIDVRKKRQKSSGQHKKSRRHGSEDSDSMSNSDVEKYEKSSRSGSTDDDTYLRKEVPKPATQKVKHLSRSRRHDSDDDSVADSREDQVERKRKQQSGSYRREKFETIPSDYKNNNHEQQKVGRRYDLEQDSGAAEDRRKEKDGPRKTNDGSDTFRKLEELSRKGTAEGSSYGGRDATSEKRKPDDEKQDERPEAKSRSLISGKEMERSRDLQKIESEISRSHRNTDDHRRDDYRMNKSGGGEVEKLERGTGIPRRGEPHHGSRRDNQDYEKASRGARGDRRQSKDEEDCRGRKHKRDEDRRSYLAKKKKRMKKIVWQECSKEMKKSMGRIEEKPRMKKTTPRGDRRQSKDEEEHTISMTMLGSINMVGMEEIRKNGVVVGGMRRMDKVIPRRELDMNTLGPMRDGMIKTIVMMGGPVAKIGNA